MLILGLLVACFIYIQVNYNIFNIDILRNSELGNSGKTASDKTVGFKCIENICEKEIIAEVATTAEEKATGLMYRDKLDENVGMLFIFDNDVKDPFWMKNCKIDLDMIYIDSDYKIVNIIESAKPCIKDPCPLYGGSVTYRYVVEVNGGWTLDNNIQIGDTVRPPT